MSQMKTHHKLGFPGILDKRYQMYHELLIASEQAVGKTTKEAKRGAANYMPIINGEQRQNG